MSNSAYTLSRHEHFLVYTAVNVALPLLLTCLMLIGMHNGNSSVQTMEHYQAYIKDHPDDIDATLTISNRYSAIWEAPEVLRVWDDFIETNPTHGEAHVQRAWLKLRNQDRLGAREDFTTACSLGMRRVCKYTDELPK